MTSLFQNKIENQCVTSCESPSSPISFKSSSFFPPSFQLTPKRPLRSEADKERRLSNRWSGQSQTYLRSASNGLDGSHHSIGKGNRDSVGTTDSTASEDDPPPPLPLKTREVDYCNLPDDSSFNYCSTTSLASITRTLVFRPTAKSKLPVPVDGLLVDAGKPPTPPPKPKRPQPPPPPAYAIHAKAALVSPSDSEGSNQDSSAA